jgi:hypothetical protein
MSAIPIITLRVEGMKYQIVHAFGEHLKGQLAEVEAAVERLCTPEYVANVVNAAARDAIDAAIKSEITAFYSYGGGRQAIKDAVKAALDEREKWRKETKRSTRRTTA